MNKSTASAGIILSTVEAYSDILLDLNALDVDHERVAFLVVVLDSMVAVRVGASSVETGQAHVQSTFVILLQFQRNRKLKYDRYVRPLLSTILLLCQVDFLYYYCCL